MYLIIDTLWLALCLDYAGTAFLFCGTVNLLLSWSCVSGCSDSFSFLGLGSFLVSSVFFKYFEAGPVIEVAADLTMLDIY